MRSRRLAVLFASLPLVSALAPLASAAEGLPPIPERASYMAAREMLIKGGYKPMAHSNAERCSTLTSVCATYPETAGCAATPSGTCRFEWTRAGLTGLAVIETQGETADGLVVVKAYEGNGLPSPYPLGTSN